MAWLFRNWHFKLGALGLATVLYTGFVYSGSFTEEVFRGIAVQAINQPEAAYPLTQQLGTVDIRYRLSADAPARVTAESFGVTVDLTAYDMGSAPQQQALPVRVASLAEGVEVLSYTPTSVPVAIDRLASKEVPVVVERGDVPDGLSIALPRIDVREVTASGPESQLGRVVRAEARVQIFESGIDVRNQQVTLVPVDIDGQQVDAVELDPPTAMVNIEVNAVETSKTVPIRPAITGAPAEGFEILSVTVDPAVVTLLGAPEDLAAITEVATISLNVAGLAETRTLEADLSVPAGARLADDELAPSVTVEVEAATASRTFVVGVQCEGVADGLACLPQQPQVSLLIRGPAGPLAALDGGDLAVTVDVSDLGAGEHSVQATVALPEGLELVSISPGNVPVLVVEPATPTPAPPG